MSCKFIKLVSYKSPYLYEDVDEKRNKKSVGKYPLILKFF